MGLQECGQLPDCGAVKYPAHSGAVSNNTVQTRALVRACRLVGGMQQLADRLGIPRLHLRAFIDGVLPVPERVFFTAVEILCEAAPGSVSRSESRAGSRS